MRCFSGSDLPVNGASFPPPAPRQFRFLHFLDFLPSVVAMGGAGSEKGPDVSLSFDVMIACGILKDKIFFFFFYSHGRWLASMLFVIPCCSDWHRPSSQYFVGFHIPNLAGYPLCYYAPCLVSFVSFSWRLWASERVVVWMTLLSRCVLPRAFYNFSASVL